MGRTTPGGAITEFPVPPNSVPEEITAGPDGNLWFTETQVGSNGTPTGSQIGRITPDGTVTEFPIPLPNGDEITGNVWFNGITAGPDGNLWFTETEDNSIGRIT